MVLLITDGSTSDENNELSVIDIAKDIQDMFDRYDATFGRSPSGKSLSFNFIVFVSRLTRLLLFAMLFYNVYLLQSLQFMSIVV